MTDFPLTQAEIDGFRGLRSLKLDGLGRVNILVGGNNSGKTSVLEALSILCQPYNPDEWLSMVSRRDFGGLDETRVQSLRWCFAQTTELTDPEQIVEAVCDFKCDGRFPLRGLHVHYSEFIGEPSPEELRHYLRIVRKARHEQMVLSFAETMRGVELTHYPKWLETADSTTFHGHPYVGVEPPSLRLWEKRNIGRFSRLRNGPMLESKTLTPYSYQLNRNQLASQSKQIFEQASPSVLELLQDFDADIQGIDLASFSGDRAAVYIKHRKLGVAPLSVFGDATRRSVLLSATLLSLRDGGVLLIDEVEAGIHVRVLGRVFEWLVKSARTLKVQVFVTTHSLEALDALAFSRPVSPLEDDIVVFRLNQTVDGTQCKRLSGDLLQRLRFERGLDVR